MLTQEAEAGELQQHGAFRVTSKEYPETVMFLGSLLDLATPAQNRLGRWVLLDWKRKPDGLVTLRSMKEALMALQSLEGGEYVLQLEDFECSEVPAKKFLALAGEILDDRFVVVSLDDRKLPWKGKEKCLKCGFKVDDWSAKKRLCDGCRGSLKKTDRVNGGTWRKGNFSVSD